MLRHYPHHLVNWNTIVKMANVDFLSYLSGSFHFINTLKIISSTEGNDCIPKKKPLPEPLIWLVRFPDIPVCCFLEGEKEVYPIDGDTFYINGVVSHRPIGVLDFLSNLKKKIQAFNTAESICKFLIICIISHKHLMELMKPTGIGEGAVLSNIREGALDIPYAMPSEFTKIPTTHEGLIQRVNRMIEFAISPHIKAEGI